MPSCVGTENCRTKKEWSGNDKLCIITAPKAGSVRHFIADMQRYAAILCHWGNLAIRFLIQGAYFNRK
jgi:hypothetical protein